MFGRETWQRDLGAHGEGGVVVVGQLSAEVSARPAADQYDRSICKTSYSSSSVLDSASLQYCFSSLLSLSLCELHVMHRRSGGMSFILTASDAGRPTFSPRAIENKIPWPFLRRLVFLCTRFHSFSFRARSCDFLSCLSSSNLGEKRRRQEAGRWKTYESARSQPDELSSTCSTIVPAPIPIGSVVNPTFASSREYLQMFMVVQARRFSRGRGRERGSPLQLDEEGRSFTRGEHPTWPHWARTSEVERRS